METRLVPILVLSLALAASEALAQPQPPQPPVPPPAPGAPPVPPMRSRGRRSDQTERFTRTVRLGANGSVSVTNISGDITVTAGSGDDVTIDASLQGRGGGSGQPTEGVIVDARGGRVDIRPDMGALGRRGTRNVDFTITVPASASVELKAISGDIKVTGVKGTVRLEAVSGSVTASGTPHLDTAKSVSGDVDLTGVGGGEGDLSVSSVSGAVRARGLKARGLDLTTVSGDITLTDITCDRVGIRTMSGEIQYDGPLAKAGRYEFNSHSGTVQLGLRGSTGFELNANTFSGSIRSELPLTIAGQPAADRRDRGRGGFNSRNIRATSGDGSAVLTVRTFSGDVVITKR